MRIKKAVDNIISQCTQILKAKGYYIFSSANSANSFFNETFDIIATTQDDSAILHIKISYFKIVLPNIVRFIENIKSSVDHLDKLKDFKFFIISLAGFSSGALMKSKNCGFPLELITIDQLEKKLSVVDVKEHGQKSNPVAIENQV